MQTGYLHTHCVLVPVQREYASRDGPRSVDVKLLSHPEAFGVDPVGATPVCDSPFILFNRATSVRETGTTAWPTQDFDDGVMSIDVHVDDRRPDTRFPTVRPSTPDAGKVRNPLCGKANAGGARLAGRTRTAPGCRPPPAQLQLVAGQVTTVTVATPVETYRGPKPSRSHPRSMLRMARTN